MADVDVSFAQVQAVRLQMLALRLLQEQKPFPAQLSDAIRQGLVAGFDPLTGAQVPVEITAPEEPEAEPVPWAERKLPVRRIDMSRRFWSLSVNAFCPAVCLERPRILARCSRRTKHVLPQVQMENWTSALPHSLKLASAIYVLWGSNAQCGGISQGRTSSLKERVAVGAN
jgi:hypothetical protein